jgi:hypothetical protein
MEWLFDRFRRRGEPIIITGVGGVGKTALLKQFIGAVRTSRPPLVWTLRYGPGEALAEISARVDELYRDRNIPEIIAIDEAEALREEEFNEITHRVLNFKAVRMLIFVSRFAPRISRAKVLRLDPLDVADAAEMLRSLLGDELSREDMTKTIAAAGGCRRRSVSLPDSSGAAPLRMLCESYGGISTNLTARSSSPNER